MNAYCQTLAMVYVKIFLEAMNAHPALMVSNLIPQSGVVLHQQSKGIFFWVSHKKKCPCSYSL